MFRKSALVLTFQMCVTMVLSAISKASKLKGKNLLARVHKREFSASSVT